MPVAFALGPDVMLLYVRTSARYIILVTGKTIIGDHLSSLTPN